MVVNRLTPIARALRRNQTSTEARLWSVLRNRQLEGLKFRRQHPIGSYVADFCCEEIGPIVELDGSQHAERQAQDGQRTLVLEDMKYLVLRFWNNEITEALDGVIEQIVTVIRAARDTRH
ncbi:MAG: DUF559 domain-containing protein [Rhizobiales bacterium]|nr:DUF559 domain-containing protein [Hyphomicrobiales bacterium]MBI3674566.1 DUF559 domain-containing protein [Hyphomicrobiales bacterium]